MTTAVLSKTDSLQQLDAIAAVFVARQSRSRDDSKSVEDQIAMGEKWAAAQTPPVFFTNIYTERDVSGRKPLEKRKGLKSAVADIEAGRAQMIVTAYFDRFVRSVATRSEVVNRVDAAGGEVMTLDLGATNNKTAASKLNGTMLAMFAEFMADQTGEKLTVTKQRNIDKGVPPFPRVTPAYERRSDGTLKLSKFAPLVREACKMRAANPPASYVTIQKFLIANGMTIGLSAVESMLSSKLLIGEIHFGDFTPNLNASEKWDGVVIDRATFRAMHERRASRGRYAKSERLLARLGVLVCATCGSKMTVHSSRGGKVGQSYPYYRCGNRHLCAAPASIAAARVEQLVLDEALKLSRDIKGRAAAVAELEEARVEREDVAQRLADTIATLSELGLMGEPASKKKLGELSIERDAKVARHERLVALTTPDMSIDNVEALSVATLDEKRRLVTMTIALASVVPGIGKDRVVEIVSHTLAQ